MTDTEKRIRIAEKCGWTFKVRPETVYTLGGLEVWHNDKYIRLIADYERKTDYGHCAGLDLARVPDYLNDLNAMHEAEHIMLTGCGSWFVWVENLRKVCGEQHPYRATARQRADAFLKTIGEQP